MSIWRLPLEPIVGLGRKNRAPTEMTRQEYIPQATTGHARCKSAPERLRHLRNTAFRRVGNTAHHVESIASEGLTPKLVTSCRDVRTRHIAHGGPQQPLLGQHSRPSANVERSCATTPAGTTRGGMGGGGVKEGITVCLSPGAAACGSGLDRRTCYAFLCVTGGAGHRRTTHHATAVGDGKHFAHGAETYELELARCALP